MIMNGRKVVDTGSLNVTEVVGLAVFLGLFLALLGPGIRVIRGVSPLPWPAIAAYSAEAAAKAGSAKEAALKRREAPFPVTSCWFPFCTSLNGQK
jgi:hypothetical protein